MVDDKSEQQTQKESTQKDDKFETLIQKNINEKTSTVNYTVIGAGKYGCNFHPFLNNIKKNHKKCKISLSTNNNSYEVNATCEAKSVAKVSSACPLGYASTSFFEIKDGKTQQSFNSTCKKTPVTSENFCATDQDQKVFLENKIEEVSLLTSIANTVKKTFFS